MLIEEEKREQWRAYARTRREKIRKDPELLAKHREYQRDYHRNYRAMRREVVLALGEAG